MKVTPCIYVSALLAVAIGCGGGGSGSSSSATTGTTTATTLSTLVMQGTASLNSAITQPTNRLSSVQSALTSFQQALAISPTDPQSNAGFAICQSAITANDTFNAFGAGLLGTSSNATQRAIQQMSIWSGTQFQAQSSQDFDDVFPIRWALSLGTPSSSSSSLSRGLPSTPAQIATDLNNLNGPLNSILAALSDSTIQQVESNPLSLQYVDKYGGTETVQIGAAELYALRSSVSLVKGVVDLALSYGFDPGSFDFNYNELTGVVPGSTTIFKPATFLPSAPFAQITSTGESNLIDFKLQWLTAAHDLNQAIAYAKARKTSNWLVNLLGVTSAQETTAAGYAGSLQTYLTQPSTVQITALSGTKATVDVNLPNWLTGNAPADLTQYFASVTAENGVAYANGGSIKDTTFGGLFPAGVPNDILYAQGLYYTNSLTNLQLEHVGGAFIVKIAQ